MAKKRLTKTEKLPLYHTKLRKVLIEFITTFPAYIEHLNKGIPLFTQDELNALQKKYSHGITWEEIDSELSSKHILLKKPTFRKYIQDGHLSKAIDYKQSGNKRVAVFPQDTITHINLIYYFIRVADKEIIDSVLDIIIEAQISYKDLIEAESASMSGSEYIDILISRHMCFEDGDLEAAIEKASHSIPEKHLKNISTMLKKIEEKYKTHVDKEIKKLVSFLEQNHTLPNPDKNEE